MILYYIQNSRREFEVSTSRKEDKRKKPKKIGFYCSSQKEQKSKKKAEKVSFYNINLYFRRIVSLRKRINDFRQLQPLHKSRIPLLVIQSPTGYPGGWRHIRPEMIFLHCGSAVSYTSIITVPTGSNCPGCHSKTLISARGEAYL